MNTAARDRALLATVENALGYNDKPKKRTPISKVKLSKEKDGSLKVALHTSKPNVVRMETNELRSALREKIGGDRAVSVEVVPEARAVAKFVRVTPRKARLVIDAIKGKRVAEAIATLRFVPNHAAELISKVLISAAANAQDGWGAGVEELKIVNILADGGPSLKRVKPRAQGRAYRILKRTSHLTVILTEAPAPARPQRTSTVPAKPKAAKAPAKPKPETAPAAPVAQTVTEQSGTETELNTPDATPAQPDRQTPDTNAGEGSTGDTANTSDAGQAPAAPAQSAQADTEVAASDAPAEATPVTASDAPEIDMSDRAPDPDDADQKRSEGE